MNSEKEKLREQVNKQTIAYINSGGQIQRCPPCTYGDKVNLTASQKKKVNSLFEKRWNKND